MIELFIILSAISLLDSLSMVPLVVLPMTVALGSARPWALASSFVAGVFITYLLCGIPLLAGAEVFFKHFSEYLNRLWNHPNTLELSVQILIGTLLVLSAWYLWRPAKPKAPADARPTATPSALFFLGASLVLLGIPGAVPYLAAIERIVNHDPDWMGATGLLIFYNLVFILPMIGLIAVRYVLAERADAWFHGLSRFCLGVMPRLTAILFLLVGLVMVADGVGWFLGYPLLPVSP